ncbi:MAG: (Fe-S)-binding protein [bacterium]
MLNTLDLLFVLVSILISIAGFAIKARRWSVGLTDNRKDNMGSRIGKALERVFFHLDLLRERTMGSYHLAIFYIFVLAILFVVFFQFAPITLPKAFSAIQSLILDILGFAALIAIIYFFYRRLYVKDKGFDNKNEDYILLAVLFFIFLTGFLMEAVRLKVVTSDLIYAPFGAFFSFFIPSNEAFYPVLSQLFWRVHFFLILFFIAYIPFSKSIHILLIPVNYIFRNNAPKGVFKLLDLENSEEFGANKISQLTWKDLMDLDTCVRCGRCQDNCPAHLTKKPLSPKKVIQDLKKVLDSYRKDPEAPLINDDITTDVLFSCTTCRACMENCPAGIEHLDKMIEMKRYLVLMEGNVSSEHQLLFKNLERNGNPWGMPAANRGEWVKDLEVPSLAELGDASQIDFLFWPGCAGAFDDRYVKAMKKLVAIFKKAGLKIAILAEEETCCGDPARKSGNEYLYDALARQNVETMNGYGVKNIITACPHCFNTISKDYTQIGGEYNVKTHVQLLVELIKSGKIILNKKLEGKVAYHDSCYLARYNGIIDEPREIIKSLGLSLVEFERRGIKGFCCGAGGGNMFLEEHAPRMNDTRISQVLESKDGKDLKGVAVGCPFCLTMMTDGTKTYDREDIEVKDLSELVYDAIE